MMKTAFCHSVHKWRVLASWSHTHGLRICPLLLSSYSRSKQDYCSSGDYQPQCLQAIIATYVYLVINKLCGQKFNLKPFVV